MRSVLSRRLPEYPEQAPTVQSFVQDVLAQPLIAPVLLFWRNFQEERPWWPVLVPLLLLVGWRSYQRERREHLARQEQRAAQRAAARRQQS